MAERPGAPNHDRNNIRHRLESFDKRSGTSRSEVDMEFATAIFTWGAVLVLISLMGGGLTYRDLQVPKVGKPARIAIAVTGGVFLITAMFVWIHDHDTPVDSPTCTATSPAVSSTVRADHGGPAMLTVPMPGRHATSRWPVTP
jgi:hypothetical protein